MLLLAGFLGIFLTTEFRKSVTSDTVKNIVNAPLMSQIEELRTSIGAFEGKLDAVGEGEVQDPAAALQPLYRDVVKQENILSSLFLHEALEAREDIEQADLFNRIKEQTVLIGRKLPVESASFAGSLQKLMRDQTETLIELVRDLSVHVRAAHREETNHLLDTIDEYERQRGLFAALVLLSGFLLILSLLSHIGRYRANAERAIEAERRNALFEAALYSTRVGVLIRDMQKEGTPVAFINDAFTQLTGYAPEDIKEQTSEFLFGWNTDPAGLVSFRRAVALHETVTLTLLLYRKDGSPFWSEWHLSPVLDERGVLTYFVSLFTDVTALRQTQDDLIQAKQIAQNASAVKTSFLAMMSHEIRTPINGILGVLKLVEETPLDAEQRHLIAIAKTSSNALHTIINDILDYAKMEAGKVEIFDDLFSMPELLEECLELFKGSVAEKGITLELDLDPELPLRFVSDAGRIRQILLNLLSNAIKFTDKGYIRLRVFSLMEQEVGDEPGRLVRFEVQDTGIGISPSDQEKLFQEFSQIERSFTRRFGGTGLGLAICRRLITLLGGEIGVESQPGKGSRFWFMVPLRVAEGTARDGRDARGDDPALLKKGVYHILLVEDNDTNRLIARRYLEKAGFLVEEATNGVEAIEKAKIADFDLILMDVSMPEMDGMLATCHIRALGGHNVRVPVVALTAHVMAGDRELCLAAGMNDYLHKPLDYDQLLRTLGRWLRTPVAPSSFATPAAALPEPEKPPPSTAWRGSALPDFDPQVLQRMQQDLGGEAVDQITKVFLSDSAVRILAFDTEDCEKIQDAAHTLKSCSGNCGLSRFSKLMENLENAAAQADRGRMNELMPLIRGVYETARGKLEAERGKYTA